MHSPIMVQHYPTNRQSFAKSDHLLKSHFLEEVRCASYCNQDLLSVCSSVNFSMHQSSTKASFVQHNGSFATLTVSFGAKLDIGCIDQLLIGVNDCRTWEINSD